MSVAPRVLLSTNDMKRHWSTARSWQLNGALVLIGIGLFLLTRQLVSEYDHFTMGFSGVSGWSATLYVAAVFLILTQPADRYTFRIILTVAIACRLVTLFADPFLSSDIYRYVWDGVVQHAHISPYRHVPGDPALTFLRAPNQEIFDNINRRDYARTIYPPAAQFLFYLVTLVSPTLVAMKTAMVLFEGVTVYALVKLLGYLGRPREQALLYAWCPLLIWEVAGSGHIDSAAIAFISLALLFRIRNQPVLTGLTLGLAVMMKFYPIVLLPALLLRKSSIGKSPRALRSDLRSWSLSDLKRLDWMMPATVLGVTVLGYAAYSSVGKLVFGFLGGYVEEEGMDTGTRYFLLELAQHIPGLHRLSATPYLVLCVLIFAALTGWAVYAVLRGPVKRPQRDGLFGRIFGSASGQIAVTQNGEESGPISSAAFLLPGFALAAALMLLFSPHYPWYILWLIPFFTLLPNLSILTYLMAMFYLCTTAIAEGSGPKQFLLNEYLYGAVLIAVIVEVAVRSYPKFVARQNLAKYGRVRGS